MRTKKEIMEDSDFIANYKNLVERNSALLVELICDMRDEQIAHNNRMEKLAAGGIFMDRSNK